MESANVQKYCYLVEHPHKGSKVFYNPYDLDLAARLAIDYAENIVIVFRLPLHELELPAQPLSAQFNAVAKPSIELPNLSADMPIEALLSGVG